MSFLEENDVSDANAASRLLAQVYAAERNADGVVPNHTRAFSHRPDVLRAWDALSSTIKSGMDRRRYELVTLAAARRLRSSYCALAHAQVLARVFMTVDEVRAVVSDPDTTVLSPLDRAIMRLADTVAAGAADVQEKDFAEVRALGLSDAEIFDIVLTVAARCFFTTVLDATGTRADAGFEDALDAETRAALTVGRPIADSEGTAERA